jgi:hypothetical protein
LVRSKYIIERLNFSRLPGFAIIDTTIGMEPKLNISKKLEIKKSKNKITKYILFFLLKRYLI